MSQGTRGGEGGPGEPEEGQQEGQEDGQEEGQDEGQEEGQEGGQGKDRRREVVEGGPQPSSKSAIQSSKKPFKLLILYVKSTFNVVEATRT